MRILCLTIVVSMSLKAAREHLKIAKKQWERASSDAWAPEDPASCVTNVFYSYENIVVAVAEAHGKKWTRNHYEKAELAEKLAEAGIVSVNVKDVILELNDLRKDVSYGEPGNALANADLEQYVADVEGFFNEVEAIVNALEGV